MNKPFFDETAAIQAWERDAQLRKEFNQNLDAWLAYARAEALGQIRILGQTLIT